MSFQQDDRGQAPSQGKAQSAPKSPGGFAAATVGKLSDLGWLDDLRKSAVNSLSGWGMAPMAGHKDTGGKDTGSKDTGSKESIGKDAGVKASPHAVEASVLGNSLKQSKGETSKLGPALEAAGRGATVAEQAQKIPGPVKMNAAAALNIASQMTPDQVGTARGAVQQANAGDGGYQSPFVSIALSGIRNNQAEAEAISTTITGDKTPHGYAAYGSNPNSYANEMQGAGPGVNSPDPKTPGISGLDVVTDTAAVTQYAAAAELGVKLVANPSGDGKQVKIDWAALSKMEVSADLGVLGGKLKYDNPAAVANNGYQAVMAEIKERGGKTDDKGQFISLTGHSGGGQSSFYTALKLASEGYKNISLVGVDMAMSPHERQVLETLGVNVTNITSNNKEGGQQKTSEVGEVIRTGMGGGANYYDLNVERQKSTDALGRHDISNDANVATTVRYAQYLDSIGQHGNYSPELYQQFLTDSNGKGNQVAGSTADPNLLSKVHDQRGLAGPEGNNPNLGGGNSIIEEGVNLLGGTGVTNAIKGVGQGINNGIDKAGDKAQSWIGGMFGKAGGFLGGLANKGMDMLGSGASAVGNFLGNGINKAGDLAQSAMGAVGSGASWLGNMASQGLGALGNGVSNIGNSIGNGLDRAGDSARSWLGGIPLVGGFLGNAADRGLDLLGSGASAIGNLAGAGLNTAGNLAQGAGNMLSSGANWLGGMASSGMNFLGNGVKSIGGLIGNGLDKAGDLAESGINTVANGAGNMLGGLVNGGIDLVGKGIGGLFNMAGDWAGAKVRSISGPIVRLLQGAGFDTSLIGGLAPFQGTNPSEQRGWENQLSDPNDPTKVQTIDVPGATPSPAPSPTATPTPGPAPTPGPGPGAPKVEAPHNYATDFKSGIDTKLAATKDLKPEQRDVVKKHMGNIPEGTIAPPEMVAVDRAFKGPNADRAMAAYSDLIKMSDADPKSKERLTPDIMAMLVSGVGDRRTDSDRGQSGILGQRQSRDAAQGLLNMPKEDYEKVVGLLEKAGKDKDGKPIAGADPRAEQALLLKAIAARRDNVKEETWFEKAKELVGIESKHDLAMKDIDSFAADIRGTKRDDLIRTTTLMDIDDVNTSKVNPDNTTKNDDAKSDNDGLYQRYNDSCAPTTQQILRGEMDPVYALKRHKAGLDNPDPDTEVAKQQGDTLTKHGGDSTLRQGDHARKELGGQITKAGLSADQTQAVNDLVTGAKLDPGKQKEASAALKVLRDKNDGHPTEGEVKSLQYNAKNSASTRTGVWQGDAAKDLSNDVTHLNLKEQTLDAKGIGPHLANVDNALKDGQPVPFNVAWTGGGAHAMMMTDMRSDATGNKTYLVSDPWTGATRWVGQKELTDGTWYQTKFGGSTSTVQDLVVDQNQTM